MRIAHVTDCYLPRVGGIEHQVQGLASRQATLGHDVHVVTATRAASGEPRPARVSVHRLGSRSVPAWGPVSPRAWVTLPLLLARLDADVVHVHASVGSPLAFLAAMWCSATGRAMVVTVHSLWGPAAGPYRTLFRLAGLHDGPAVWTAVSRVAARDVAAALPDGAAVEVIPNGVDASQWRRHAPAIPSHAGPVRVVSVLRLTARKRPLAVLEVLRRTRVLVPRTVQLRATVIGDGPLRGAAERYVRRHALDWVDLPGTRSADQVRAELHRADVFLAAARLESFGIAALEARCAGVPVVALAGTGSTDFVRPGRDGVIAQDDDGLVAGLATLVGDPAARRALAEISQPPGFGWAATLDAAAGAYAAALARSRRPQPQRLPEVG